MAMTRAGRRAAGTTSGGEAQARDAPHVHGPADYYPDPGMALAGRSRIQRSNFMQRQSRFELGHD